TFLVSSVTLMVSFHVPEATSTPRFWALQPILATSSSILTRRPAMRPRPQSQNFPLPPEPEFCISTPQ
ncbi:unnamed protein product, partial [Chondrus crispus]